LPAATGRKANRVVLGLGTNLGDREEQLRAAIRALRTEGLAPEAVAPLYESDAMLIEGSPDSWKIPFLNTAVLTRSELSSEELLEKVKSVEHQLGRQKRERWAPREIDIDILAIEGTVHQSERLVVPHRGLPERPFALLPLLDVWPEYEPRGQAEAWLCAPADARPFRTHKLPRRLTEWVGILNVTPDSFSDGGRNLRPGALLAQAEKLIEDGASWLDLGAESTRPGATLVNEETEWERLEPALTELKPLSGRIRLSLDTRRAAIARRSLGLGVTCINDVSGASDPAMPALMAETGVDYVLMHHLGVPPVPQKHLPLDRDPLESLLDWAEAQIRQLESQGVRRSQILFDPGIGFGKTREQNFAILARAHELHQLGIRLLVGHSRKGFLAPDRPAPERDLETALLSARLSEQAVDYVRVHDIALQRRVIAGGLTRL